MTRFDSPDSEVEDSPATVQYDDNALVQLLCGEYDQNLARIEQALGVSLYPRGNRIAISGAASARDTAKHALDRLYDRLRRGLEVDFPEIDAAVRMAGAAQARGAPADHDGLVVRTPRRHVTPRSATQGAYIKALIESELVFGLGPAGTGKTYLAVSMAVSSLLSGAVDRIILCRPAVEAGENLGFLPGDMREKIDPYLRPLYDALHDMLPGDQVNKRLNSGEIEIAPLAFMRGRTLSNAFIIVDEAQNTTPMQMKMILTRLGENSRMAVTGDLSQTDLPKGTESGLADAVDRLANVRGLAVVRFSDVDVVRHALVTRIVRAYDAPKSQSRRGAPAGDIAAGDSTSGEIAGGKTVDGAE